MGAIRSANAAVADERGSEIVEDLNAPFILMGDFNSTPQTEELRVFQRGAFVQSCFPGPVVTHRATRQCLDYIFVDRGWEIANAQVVQSGPSDHWPLVAELRRSSEASATAR